MEFKIGELVYHKSLKIFGVFNGQDDIDKDTCHFDFKDEYDMEDYKRVSIDKIEKSPFAIGSKVRCIKTVRESCVLKMRINQTGIVNNVYYKYIVIKLENGELIKCTRDNVELYSKKSMFNIEDCNDEELLDRFENLIRNETYSKTTKTKSYDKLLKDIERYREEIIERMKH